MRKDFIYKNTYNLIAATNDLCKLVVDQELPIFIGLDKYDSSERITTNYNNTPTEINSIGFCENINTNNLTIEVCMESSDASIYAPDLYCITVHLNPSNGINNNAISLYLTRKYIKGVSIIDGSEVPLEFFNKYPLSYLRYAPFNVIVLCGSTRFDFIKAQEVLTLAGNVVISPSIYGNFNNRPLSEQELLLLKRLQKQKINMADEVMIIDSYGYIGHNTLDEIDYAKLIGKKVTYWSEYLKQTCNDSIE